MSSGALFRRLIGYRPALFAVLVLLWGGFLLGTLVPGLLIRAFFDLLTGHAEVSIGIPGLLALLVATELARLVFSYGAVASGVSFMHGVGALLRLNMLEGVLSRPASAALPGAPAESMSRFRDDVGEIMAFLPNPPYAAGHLLVAVGAVSIMATVDPLIAASTTLPLIFVVSVTAFATSRLQRLRRASRIATARVVETLAQMFEAVQSIQLAGAEPAVIARLRRLNDERRRSMVRDGLFSEVLGSVFANAVGFGTGAILLLAARGMRDGSFTVGDFAMFQYYLWPVLRLPLWLGRVYAEYKQAAIASERTLGLVAGEAGRPQIDYRDVYLDRSAPPVPFVAKNEAVRLEVLEVEGLGYRYPSSGKGVEGVDLRVQRGSFVVITGRVASGKTTLLKCLLGMVPDVEGTVRWNGEVVEDPCSFMMAPRCAYAPQVPRLFSETLRDNVLMGLPLERVDLDAAARRAVLDPRIEGWPQGWDTVAGARGAKLSGGQIQRAAACRMFVRDAELNVVDDPSSALDAETEARLWASLADSQGAACIAVSTRRSALRRADHVLVLDAGRVAGSGSLDSLLESCVPMREIWEAAGAETTR